MKFILPLKIKHATSSIKLPYILFEIHKKQIIQIEDFSVQEKEEFFSIKNLKINDSTFTYKPVGTILRSSTIEDQKCLLGNYKVVISSQSETPGELQKAQRKLDFVLKIVLGCGLPMAKIESENTMYKNSRLFAGNVEVSRREIDTLDEDKLSRITNLLTIVLSKNPPKKTDSLQFFLETAMKQVPNIGISGAFYITILESLMVPEKSSEIRYRLSMRLTKKREQDELYKKKIGNLYVKRCKIFHGDTDKFTKENLIFLEKEVAWAIEEYLKEPNLFEAKELDKALLN